MANDYSAKRNLDRMRFAARNKRTEEDVSRFGLTRDHVSTAQARLQGYIVMPGDPNSSGNRALFNPVFHVRSPMPCEVKQKYDSGSVYTLVKAFAPVSSAAKPSHRASAPDAAIAAPIIVDAEGIR